MNVSPADEIDDGERDGHHPLPPSITESLGDDCGAGEAITAADDSHLTSTQTALVAGFIEVRRSHISWLAEIDLYKISSVNIQCILAIVWPLDY